MGSSGLCCYCLLADTEITRSTLMKVVGQKYLVEQKNEEYTEFFRSVHPATVNFALSELHCDKAKALLESLKENPRPPNNPERLSYPIATIFRESGIKQLVARSGGES